MDLQGKVLGNRYQLIEKVGNRRDGNCLQSKRFNTK